MSTVGHPDTSPDAERLQAELLRHAGPARQFEICRQLTATAKALSRRALRRAHPELTDDELAIEWIAVHYGRDLAEAVRRRSVRRP